MRRNSFVARSLLRIPPRGVIGHWSLVIGHWSFILRSRAKLFAIRTAAKRRNKAHEYIGKLAPFSRAGSAILFTASCARKASVTGP